MILVKAKLTRCAEGTDTSQGTPQLLSNISACIAVAQTIATTLGPRGMDKLIVDERGQATISSELFVAETNMTKLTTR
jgi:chaperonin GroEL (HSP60 family)